MPLGKDVAVSSSSTLPRANGSDEPTVLEMLESVLLLISGAVVAAPMLPGLTLCVPALVLLTVAVLVPVLAVAALVTVVVGVLAIPYLLVRSIRSISSRRPAPAPEAVPMLAVDM
jgi:hypothetical protein